MNAGKSTSLLQSNHNYLESNLDTIIFLPDETNKSSKGQIVSRIGLKAKAVIADKDFNFIVYITNLINKRTFPTRGPTRKALLEFESRTFVSISNLVTLK